ncbi:tyrosine-type recombinase/integrase [Burkholderia cenocepacia]|uniref:tyrosine-type recombinase/integrase n=1 Tax=Burkholderia cenocepacia TaxID=95486 RepID=UPI00076BCAA1|nr:tyrosine-type recombinase/integrase [Burkholderia cenocepacia]KWU17790.1 hypothetical protein AS149_13805 [Burkholderia cenocepacia]
MLAALQGAGGYLAQKRVFGLVKWTYQTLREQGMTTLTQAANELIGLFAPDERLTHDMLVTTWQDQMVAAAGEIAKGWKRVRLMAIVTVLCETALKNQEILELRTTDLYGAPPHTLRAGKGVKQRDLVLSAKTGAALTEWLKVRPDNPGDYLFVADTSGRPLDPATLWRQLKRVTSAVPGSEEVKHFGTGVIRATKAKELEELGASTADIAGFLGHRLEASTGELLDRVRHRDSGRAPSLI